MLLRGALLRRGLCGLILWFFDSFDSFDSLILWWCFCDGAFAGGAYATGLMRFDSVVLSFFDSLRGLMRWGFCDRAFATVLLRRCFRDFARGDHGGRFTVCVFPVPSFDSS